MNSLILASASPRRQELLTLLNLPFTTYPTDVDETLPENISPVEAVQQLAFKKAKAALQAHNDSIIIGCDTIVVHKNHILGKPIDHEDAFRMLLQLSNETHAVYTGVCLLSNKQTRLFYEKTEVTFWELTQQEILAYIESGDPFDKKGFPKGLKLDTQPEWMDKAGAYGIQGKAALFVKSIRGDYYNVVGLPISRLSRELSIFANS